MTLIFPAKRTKASFGGSRNWEVCLYLINKFIFLFAIEQAEFTPEQARDARVKLLENCRSTVEGVTDDDVRNAAGFNIPKTRSGKCLAACVQKATKLVCTEFLN